MKQAINPGLTMILRRDFSCEALTDRQRERRSYRLYKGDAVNDFLEGKFEEAGHLFETAIINTESLEEKLALHKMSIECEKRAMRGKYGKPKDAAEGFKRLCRHYEEVIRMEETPGNCLAYMEFLGKEMPNAGAYMVDEAIQVGSIAISLFPEDGRLYAAMHDLYALKKSENEAHECMVTACKLKYDDPDFLLSKFGARIWEQKEDEQHDAKPVPFSEMMRVHAPEIMENPSLLYKYGKFMLENIPMLEYTYTKFLFIAYTRNQELPGLKESMFAAYERSIKFVRSSKGNDIITPEFLSMLRTIKNIKGGKEPMPKELEHIVARNAGKMERISAPPAREIKKLLDEYIIGQEKAKRVLSVGLWSHLKRLKAIERGKKIDKSNLMFLGTTGSGKTYTAEVASIILSEILGMQLPFLVYDTTKLTEEGIIGEKVDTALEGLLNLAGGDMELAQMGVIFLDEIDKKKTKEGGVDPGGQGAQQQLMKPVEGCTVNIRVGGPHGRKIIQMDTTNILFISGGAFSKNNTGGSLTSNVAKKGGGIGFGRNQEMSIKKLMKMIMPQDLIDYGFLPEFVARFPIRVPFYEFTQGELKDILTKPKKAILPQYQALLEDDKEGIELKVTENGLDAITELAMQQKLGARSLRVICEAIFSDALYELPGTGIRELIVDKDFVLHNWEKED